MGNIRRNTESMIPLSRGLSNVLVIHRNQLAATDCSWTVGAWLSWWRLRCAIQSLITRSQWRIEAFRCSNRASPVVIWIQAACSRQSDEAKVCSFWRGVQSDCWRNKTRPSYRNNSVYWFVSPCRLPRLTCPRWLQNAGYLVIAVYSFAGNYLNLTGISWRSEL